MFSQNIIVGSKNAILTNVTKPHVSDVMSQACVQLSMQLPVYIDFSFGNFNNSTYEQNTHTHTHTHNRFTALLESVRDYPGEQVPER